MGVIYKIEFNNKDFYIGQTNNWAQRQRQHINTKGKGSPLLEEAWKLNQDPVFQVLEEVETENLDTKEIYWIKMLKPNLNVLPGGKSNRGLASPKLKYSESQIEDVVWYWCNTTMNKTEIQEATKVNYSTVCDILAKRTHTWATENINLKDFERKNYYKIYDPLGNCFEGCTLEELEKKTNISKSVLYSLVTSKSGENRMGWTTYYPTMYKLTSPENQEVVLSKSLAKTLLQDSGLSPYQVDRMIKHQKPSAGWKIITCPQKGD